MFTNPLVRMYFNGLLVHDEELHDSCLQMARLGPKWGGDPLARLVTSLCLFQRKRGPKGLRALLSETAILKYPTLTFMSTWAIVTL